MLESGSLTRTQQTGRWSNHEKFVGPNITHCRYASREQTAFRSATARPCRRQAEIPHRNPSQKGPRLAAIRRLHQGRDCARAWRRAAYAAAAFSCQRREMTPCRIGAGPPTHSAIRFQRWPSFGLPGSTSPKLRLTSMKERHVKNADRRPGVARPARDDASGRHRFQCAVITAADGVHGGTTQSRQLQ